MPLIEINKPILWVREASNVAKLMEALTNSQPLTRKWASGSRHQPNTEFCFDNSPGSVVELHHPHPDVMFFITEEEWKNMSEKRRLKAEKAEQTDQEEASSSVVDQTVL